LHTAGEYIGENAQRNQAGNEAESESHYGQASDVQRADRNDLIPVISHCALFSMIEPVRCRTERNAADAGLTGPQKEGR